MKPGRGCDGRRVLVLGGSSEIALALVRKLQERSPRDVALLGRDLNALSSVAEELRTVGCPRVMTVELDVLDLDQHEQALGRAVEELGGVDIVILAVGVLGVRGGLPADLAEAENVMQVNLVGAGSLLMRVASRLRDQGSGTIVVLSSIAAERPRRANVVYGASKAALDSLAQGLADDLHDRGVRVLVVRPGFVATKMTHGLEPAPLATTPQVVADVVIEGLERGSSTVWAPRSLRWLALAMRLIPRPLFRRIKR